MWGSKDRYEGQGNDTREKRNGVIMFKRLPEELTLIYVFKDGPSARIVGRIGYGTISLS